MLRVQEFASFSYDDNHQFRLGDSSLKWYYPPQLNVDLSNGYEKFDKHDDSADEHLDSLLQTVIAHEQSTRAKIDAQVVTWRGMMTKVRPSPFQQTRRIQTHHPAPNRLWQRPSRTEMGLK